VLRDDKGGEFIGKEFSDFCADNGILRQHTEPGEPHQNGVAERANEDIAAGATALLVQAKLPPSFWALAVSTYVHTRNRTPTSALNGETPYLHWKGKKPDISYFRVFGSLAYVLIRREHRKALQAHSRKCIFVGYPDGVKAWHFWDPIAKRFIVSSHAVFDERHFPGNSTTAIDLMTHPPPKLIDGTPQVVLHQGGDEETDDESPPDANSNPVPMQPAMPLAQPAPAEMQALPAPVCRNPARTSRFHGSLNETELSKHQNSPHSTSASTQSHHQSPDPLLLQPIPAAPDPEPLSPLNSQSESDDELLLKGNSDQETVETAIGSGLEYVFSALQSDYLSFDEAINLVLANADCAFKVSTHQTEPRSFLEAMKRPEEERAHWYKAAVDEIQSLIENVEA
jgi:hypothetical protein